MKNKWLQAANWMEIIAEESEDIIDV